MPRQLSCFLSIHIQTHDTQNIHQFIHQIQILQSFDHPFSFHLQIKQSAQSRRLFTFLVIQQT